MEILVNIVMLGMVLAVATTTLIILLEGWITIMATLAEVNAKLDAVAAGVDSLEATIQGLKRQLAEGSPVTQADLDALSAKLDAIGADISDTSDHEPAPTSSPLA